MKADGLLAGPSTGRMMRLLLRDRLAAREDLEAILAWDFERVTVTHGVVLDTHSTTTGGARYRGASISSDGRRYATSAEDELNVWEETPSETWSAVLTLSPGALEQFGRADLSADGSRLGY